MTEVREVDDLAATIEARAATLARTLVRNPRSTVEPPRPESDDRTRLALNAWQALAAGPTSRASRLAIERTLGEGGMGLVRLAEQVTVGRKVAVKTLRDGARDREAILKLLREAWITGALEHPNIVPIYDVGVDAEGGPQIVLKRIEGVAWRDVISDPEQIARRFNADDALEWNLRILGQVCRAVHFAHARGILHRDLKPDNVMIGGFGEVYVLDWGIAVALKDDGTGRFPLVTEAHDMAGTPVYMAPEMLGGEAPRLGPATDIYLLGAILYEIVTGRPPHDEPNMQAIVASVIISEPKHLEDVPAELAQIIRRAMAREPEDRFATAEELRVAVEDYLRHRGSTQIAAEATQSLAKLRAEIASGGKRRSLYNLLGECRFGFRAALVEFDDNEEAREGLREALIAMARWELDQREPDSAAVLIDELEPQPKELLEKLEQVRVERAAEAERVRRLQAIERDLDKGPGARTRVFIATVMGALWIISPLVRHFSNSRWMHGHLGTLVVDIFQVVIVSGLGYWARDSMMKTAVNRRLMATLVVTFVAQTVLGLAGWQAGIPPLTIHWLHLFLWSLVLAMTSIHLERGVWPSAIVVTLWFLFSARRLEYLYLGMAATDAVIVTNLLLVWSPRVKNWKDYPKPS
jgi:eukaryotic-like serine/threonine-protein kinase